MNRSLNILYAPLDSQQNVILYVPNSEGDQVTADLTFSLELQNTGTQPIILKKGEPVSDQSPGTSSFLLAVYLPETFQSSELNSIQVGAGQDWKIQTFSDDGNYLMLSPSLDISIAAQGNVKISISGFKTSSPRQISQTLNLNLYNLDPSIIGDGIYTTSVKVLQVPKVGNQDLVLISQPEDSPIVYLTPSDSPANNENSLNFYLTNSNPNSSKIPAKANVSYIRISFDTGIGLGDLASAADLTTANLSLLREYENKFTSSKEVIQNIPTWKFTAATDTFLNGGSNDRIEFQISDLVSHIQPGIANAYLEFFNIPGFNDGYASFSLQKELPAAVISEFFISPPQIAYGDSITVQWQTQGAEYCTLNSNIGSMQGQDGQTVQNYQTFPAVQPGIKFVPVLSQIQNSQGPVLFSVGLSAFTEDGRSNSRAIGILIQPVHCSLSASTTGPIKVGDSITLTWQSQFAHSLSIDQGIGAVQANDSVRVSPKNTTTYTLVAQGLYGPAIASVTVQVESVKINLFQASTSSGNLGDQITFTWDTESATSLDINGTTLSSAKGSIQLPLTNTYSVFTLTCQGGNGPVSSSITVTAINGVQITGMSGYWQSNKFYFEAAKANVNWQTARASSCQLTVNGSLVSSAISGSAAVDAGTGDAPQSVTFVLTAQGPGGPVSQAYTVNP